MKLHFEDNLDYQLTAIEAVVDLFRGQEINRTEFTVSRVANPTGQTALPGLAESELGIGNRLQLLDDELLENLKEVQLKNELRLSTVLSSGDFTVEMETGTGKTYVYLRTIFELNKRYGFAKFMIVVPSVAIKEGVYKTLQITQDHFENLYPTAKGYEYFLYNSRKLGQVRNYATNPTIQIMVVTVGAINRTKRLVLVDGIRYQRIGDNHYYAQELFKEDELTGYLKATLETQKSVYERVVYDSAGIEHRFAEELETNEAVKVYAKLPGWFTIPTPLGTYNPDWAVLVENDGQEKLYFVVETKSSGWGDDLRHKEDAKITCGEKHFAALDRGGNSAKYVKATTGADMMSQT